MAAHQEKKAQKYATINVNAYPVIYMYVQKPIETTGVKLCCTAGANIEQIWIQKKVAQEDNKKQKDDHL